MQAHGHYQIFFAYVCNGKKIKEFFASTLNRIAASVRCVSSMIVVLNAELPRLITAHADKRTVRNEEALQETS